MTTITIGSLEGGGGVELGQLVAQRLGYDYVDRLILAEAAKQAGTTVAALHEREEVSALGIRDRFFRVLRNLLEQPAWSESDAAMGLYYGAGNLPFLTEDYEQLPQPPVSSDLIPKDQTYYEAISKVMNDLTERGSVVIVGRGGSYILRGNQNVLRVGVVAQLEDRIARIMKRSQISHEEAQKLVDERDKARTYYFKRLFDVADSMSMEHYHLIVNSSEVSFEYAADMVEQACNALEAQRLRR